MKLEPHLLEFFLKRLNVDLSLTNDGIPYLEVINAFKQKSDPTRKRINADNQLSLFFFFKKIKKTFFFFSFKDRRKKIVKQHWNDKLICPYQ